MSAAVTDAIGVTNGKLDQVKSEIAQQKAAIEANTSAVNAQGQATQDAINAQGQATQDAINANGEMLGEKIDETNSLLDEIKNVFSDEGKDAVDQLGQASEDPRYLGALSNAESSLNTFANSLTLSSTACVSDMEIQIPIFGAVNIALSQWCSLLALLKILAHLSVLFACLRMLDSTVRAL